MKLPCRLTLWQTNRYVALFLHHLQQIQQYHPPKSTGKSQEIYIITTIFHRGLWNRKKIWLWIVKNRGYGKQFQSAMHQKTLSNRNSSSNVHVNSIGLPLLLLSHQWWFQSWGRWSVHHKQKRISTCFLALLSRAMLRENADQKEHIH